ncbi:MAG: Arm DNA-binding domain-containing protein [Candidatus Eisenbacteria bacterium]|nr:Arm DNA-binding domain-containing protein [Candidatus Eisenbacteria bacterium]
MPLTDTVVRSAKPASKAVKLADERGMYLLLSPRGSKLWRFDYRFDGRRRTLALGVYPDVSLKAARERRDQARALLTNGVDPGATRKAEKASGADGVANSFEVVAREWFDKQVAGWAQTHADKVIQRLEKDVFPWLGKRHEQIDRTHHRNRPLEVKGQSLAGNDIRAAARVLDSEAVAEAGGPQLGVIAGVVEHPDRVPERIALDLGERRSCGGEIVASPQPRGFGREVGDRRTCRMNGHGLDAVEVADSRPACPPIVRSVEATNLVRIAPPMAELCRVPGILRRIVGVDDNILGPSVQAGITPVQPARAAIGADKDAGTLSERAA